MSRFNAYLIVVLIWAGLYIPGLGMLDIDYNEGRRIMPAVGMIESGNWKVPTFEGEEYFRKPPMINWLIAGSFIAFGEMDGFAARFPSALAVLAFVSLLVLMPSPFLNLQTRLVSAIFFLTCAGCLGNGRQAEIDSVYSCVSGMAMITWLNLWARERKDSFALWFFPSLIIGFGLLLKGPVVLFFFYTLVIAVLAYEGRVKILLGRYHVLGIALMLGIFLSWMLSVPSSGSAANTGGRMTGTWFSEIMMRFYGEKLNLAKWPARASGAFLRLLPWLIFAPLLFSRSVISRIPEEHMKIFRGSRFAIIAVLIAINLMPGVKARYSMPIYALALVAIGWMLILASLPRIEKIWRSLLLVLAGILASAGLLSFVMLTSGIAGKLPFIKGDALAKMNTAIMGMRSSYDSLFTCGLVMAGTIALFIWLLRRREVLNDSMRLAIASGAVAVAANLTVVSFAMPVAVQFQDGHKAFGTKLSRIADGAKVHAYNMKCEPFFFYVGTGVKFLRKADQIGNDVKFLICQERLKGDLDAAGVLSDRKILKMYREKHDKEDYVLIILE